MAQRKTVLFLGRKDPHMGYDYCVKLCRRHGWKLIIAAGDRKDVPRLMKQADAVFTTGYLGIMESYLANKEVLWSWNNPLKEDYIKMHPMYGKSLKQAHTWSKQQTWAKLATIYEKLWQK
ncbi:MAG: hypothetical protein AAB697_01345 [Patescibacteria group bacterium]